MRTSKNLVKLIGNSGLALALGGVACGAPSEGVGVEQREFDIITGFHADSPQLNHTGALVVVDPLTGEIVPFCSSTLIGPETVVTAKHCAVIFPQAESAGFVVAWAAGPRAEAPDELIPIVAADSAPGDVGGFVGMGRDVAVGYLEHPTAISPAVPKLLTPALVGQAMVSIGYGVYGASGAADDQRRIGRETIAATEGRVFEVMFGTFEDFVEWAFTGQVTDQDFLATVSPDDPFIEQLRVIFDTQILFDQHEVVTGLSPSDTQSCFGDSGGPLARFSNGTWETYGVVSGGLGSLRSACDFGGVFSSFGPQSLAFLQAARQWSDPCGDVTAAGACSDGQAQRCETSLVAGIRRLATQDCTAAGLPCVSNEQGVGCGTVPLAVPVDPPDPGADQQLLEGIESAFRPEVQENLSWRPRGSSN